MKKRIIYLIGTVLFLAVLTLTIQFDNSLNENNNVSIQNLEALAFTTLYCSNTCYENDDEFCMACPICDVIPGWDEADVKASTCEKEPE